MVRPPTRSMCSQQSRWGRWRRALAVTVAAAAVVTACGSDDEAAEPEITLLPTTAPSVTTVPDGGDSVVITTPVTEPPATESPVTEPPVTEPPATEPPSTESADAGTDADTSETPPPSTDAAGSPPAGDDDGDGGGDGDGVVADDVKAALELTERGLGGVQFGAEPEGVITFVSSLLGAPTADTGWVDPFTIGACSGNEIRLVNWGVLELLFGDASTVLEGRRHFYAYAYGFDGEIGAAPAGLVTADGITIGSPLFDVLTAYPTAQLNPEDDFLSANFVVSDNLRGFLTGLGDDDRVTVILGGIGCAE